MKLASPELIVPESITKHPYVKKRALLTRNRLQVPRILASPEMFEEMTKLVNEAFRAHVEKPFTIIVGDDVSGRIPALVLHRFLRRARTEGRIGTVPKTYFMTSGLIPRWDRKHEEEHEDSWRGNLTRHAKRIMDDGAEKGEPVERVGIVTEYVREQGSIKRLEGAFINNGVNDIVRIVGRQGLNLSNEGLYLHGLDKDKEVVGVQKFSPEPISRRHPDFKGRQSALLRHFLGDYADALYDTTFHASDKAQRSVD